MIDAIDYNPFELLPLFYKIHLLSNIRSLFSFIVIIKRRQIIVKQINLFWNLSVYRLLTRFVLFYFVF